MKMAANVFWPMLVLIGWTAGVGCLAVSRRVNEIRTKRIPLQSIARPRDIGSVLEDTQATDNFNNLLQVPLLFYVWCLAAVQLHLVNDYVLLVGWSYVGLRIAHTVIQVTHNRVMPRFRIWALSNFILILLWAIFAIWLMQQVA
jgi:hypothetical protein